VLNSTDLSLEQAPPISIPLRFFLSAPFFMLAAGLLLLFAGPELFISRWSPQVLAFTHLLTLGVLAIVMVGAMFQMLPVLAGSPVPQVGVVGTLVHLSLTTGTIFLVAGFLLSSAILMVMAAIILAVGFSIFVVAIGISLWRVELPSATIIGMRLSLLAMAVTVVLGVLLALAMAGVVPLTQPLVATNIHLVWGFLGWVALLLMGVAYQVVPMFQVTPEYPSLLRRMLIPLLLVGLAVWSLLQLLTLYGYLPNMVAELWLLLLLIGYVLFAVVTLRLQQKRRRYVPDVTLMFWRVGMVAVLLAGILWALSWLLDVLPDMDLMLGVLLLLGVALSLVNGMLYKIVPFLSWFHLQNRQLALMCMTVRIPHMKELLPDRAAKVQYWLHLGGIVFALLAAVIPEQFARPAGVLLALSATLLGWNIAQVIVRYSRANRALMEAVDSVDE